MKKSELKRTCTLKNNGSRLKQNKQLKADPAKRLSASTSLKSKSSLVVKTSLKANTKLEAKTPLKNNGAILKQIAPLKANSQLKSNTSLESNTELKVRQKSAKKLKMDYFSIFGSLDFCAITGEKKKRTGKGKWNVIPHHIFGGAYKSKSEKYGFILPLRIDWHTGHTYSIHEDIELDKKYKKMCQDYYMNVLGKSEESFIKEFGKSYLQ